ncbi:capsule biosynthesis protein [Serratia phage 4S]|nr:capsule biosynthesis protein [Serratia phage 4S]
MKLTFDIDETITQWDDNRDYENFVADKEMVSYINSLYDQGHTITLYTARGMGSCGPGRIAIDIVPSLIKNLEKIGLKYHELLTHKPVYDWIIDDKAMTPQRFKELMRVGLFEQALPYQIPRDQSEYTHLLTEDEINAYERHMVESVLS